jgi:hypothetical protein
MHVYREGGHQREGERETEDMKMVLTSEPLSRNLDSSSSRACPSLCTRIAPDPPQPRHPVNTTRASTRAYPAQALRLHAPPCPSLPSLSF